MSEGRGSRSDEGLRLLQANDLDGALALLQQEVSESPTDGRAFGLLGVCLARKGQGEPAAAALAEAARLQPADAAAQYNLAVALYQLNRTEEARTSVAKALALNPGHADAQKLQALLPPPAPTSGSWSVPTPVPAPPTDPGATMIGYPTSPFPTGDPGATQFGPLVAPSRFSDPTSPASRESPPEIRAVETSTLAAAPPRLHEAPAANVAVGSAHEPVVSGGLQYRPPEAAAARASPPPLGLRLLRGWGWGLVFGQWWTLWTVVSSMLWGGLPSAVDVAGWVLYAFIYSFFGTLAGLVIALSNAGLGVGQGVGVGIGLLLCLIEVVVFKNPRMLVNLFFYFFTGRYIGMSIAAKVQQPVGK